MVDNVPDQAIKLVGSPATRLDSGPQKVADCPLMLVIVDQSLTTRTVIRSVLSADMPQLHITDFPDPFQALAWCTVHPVDLVLIEYEMPGLDGLELARRLRTIPDYHDVPILIMTMSDDHGLRHSVLAQGIFECLVKPIRPRELCARCHNVLDLRLRCQNLKQHTLSLERRLIESMNDVHERERETLLRLARAIESRDAGTSAYLERMTQVVGLIARQLGLHEDRARLIAMAAHLHDIGTIAIPDAILRKGSHLTTEELALIRLHPQMGYDLLSDSQNCFIQVAAMIALRHHERYDGSGYPDQLVGENIPLEARIVAVADVFDALVSPRPYKQPWSIETAMDYLYAQRGRLFDPQCVEVLLQTKDQLASICQRFDVTVVRSRQDARSKSTALC